MSKIDSRYLFRGKRIDNGTWTIGCLCDDHLGETDRLYIVGIGVKTGAIIPATVGQCTGLRDKNGRLIWEGDIIFAKGLEGNDDFVGVIKWYGDDGFTAFSICKADDWIRTQGKSPMRMFANLEQPDYRYEVIGNIFDNPELIGGDDA